LKDCLASLLKINFPEYEIIIVDDASIDGTKDFLDDLKSDKIKVVHHPVNLGVSVARNTGIKLASFGVIAFTDDDCEVDKNWLLELAKGFADERTGFVIGQTFYIRKGYRGYFPERLVQNPGAKWPMSSNIAYQKKVFAECGDFDNLFFSVYNNEDSEMAIRAASRGFLFGRSPDAVVYHQAMDWNIKSLLRSARNASVWPVLKKKYPDHYSLFGPPIRFGFIVNARDYLYLLTAPIFIPLLFIRYIMNGKRDFKIFFIKWPIYLVLRRYYVYREAVRNRILMI
jgi:glycosyltransferase involved in cell wall biosynthesis